jgi:integrase
MIDTPISADSTFAEAARSYLILRAAPSPSMHAGRYIRSQTEKDYATKIRSAELFFGKMRLSEIHWHHLRAYQAARHAGADPFVRKRRPHDAIATPCPAKPQQINQELRLVKKLKMLSGCWTAEDDSYYQTLQQEESDAERALSPEHQDLWLSVAKSRPRWESVYLWSLVSFDLLTSTNELRGLQIGHVNLRSWLVRIPWACAKNRFRHREIPVEDPWARWALEMLIERAASLGSHEPHHHLFPFRITRKKEADPTRPMTSSGLKKLWQEVREATGLLHFRMYDTRHTGATRLAESGVPAPVIMARMGHSNVKMQQHYQHITEQAQRAWLRAAQAYPGRRPPQSVGADTYAIPVDNFAQKRY